MRTIVQAAACIALGLAPTVSTAPVAATQASLGTLDFAGSVALPTFPCPPPDPGESPCVGTFTASTAGVLTGRHGTSPWQVSLQSVTTGQFGYTDHLEPGVPCTEGVAVGSASLDTREAGQAFGTYHDEPVPLAVRNVTIAYDYTWVRRGVTALLDVSDVVVRLQVDELGWVTVTGDGRAHATATFVPHVSSDLPSGCAGGEPTPLGGSFIGTVTGVTATP